MVEINKDKALEALADYIVNNDLNYVGGVFEREDSDELFEVTVAKKSAHRKLTEELQAKNDLLDLKIAECERLREAVKEIEHLANSTPDKCSDDITMSDVVNMDKVLQRIFELSNTINRENT